MKLSYVVPCYNSENTIELVVEEIISATKKMAQVTAYEIILVNDSSPDDTEKVIMSLAENNPRIKALSLAKNFGQHAALLAGYHIVTGDIVVSLDDDGQTPADETYKLLEKLDEGYDVVYARYQEKKHKWWRNMGSKVNDKMAHVLLGKPKGLYVSSFFAARRYVIDKVEEYPHPYPYVIGLVLRTTKHIANVDIHHRSRVSGRSSYNMSKLVALWLNGFTAFSVKPLRIATMVGVLCSFIGFVFGLYIIIRRLANPEILMGYSSTMAVILFIGGMLMLMIGIVGEYIGRIYISINKSPQFVIRKSSFSQKSENKEQ
ncbi:MAG: glycosyltransferase family 2 protein [Clostridiales bacterium]|nr:glycosyltransferase family 2 protein [Clostridiales bacterium]